MGIFCLLLLHNDSSREPIFYELLCNSNFILNLVVQKSFEVSLLPLRFFPMTNTKTPLHWGVVLRLMYLIGSFCILIELRSSYSFEEMKWLKIIWIEDAEYLPRPKWGKMEGKCSQEIYVNLITHKKTQRIQNVLLLDTSSCYIK